MDLEETLLTLTDERAQIARTAPDVTPVDSSERGAPVQELIRPSVLGEPLVDHLQEPTPVVKKLEYAIQAIASLWEPLEQAHCVVSREVDFDSFGMAPWDAGGRHGEGCRFYETFWTMMFQWLIRLSCRPVIRSGLVRTMRMNMEYGLEKILMTNTDSPRLAVTPGEWYASDAIWVIRTDLRQMNGFTQMMVAMCDYTTAEVFTQIDSAAADCGADELDDFIFHRTEVHGRLQHSMGFPPYRFRRGLLWHWRG